MKKIKVTVAGKEHLSYVPEIKTAIISASKIKGTGLSKRSAEYINEKILEGKAIIAIFDNKKFAGFCYIESWGHKRFVANSGLIVPEEFRGMGLAINIKRKAFNLSRILFPTAKLFGLTTSLAVMKLNSALGYKPVTFSELTDDDEFWKGCQTCAYYDILFRTNRTHCLCTAMLCDNKKAGKNGKKIHKIKGQLIGRFIKEKRIHLRQGYGGRRMRKREDEKMRIGEGEKGRRGEGEKEAGKTCQSAPKVLLVESEGIKSDER